MTQKGNLAAVCVLVLLLELTSLVPGQQCSSTYQPIPGPPGRDGRDGNDGSAGRNGIDGSPGSNGNDGTPGRDGNDGSAGSNGNHGTPGRDGRDGSPAVFTHEDFLKLKEMLIDEGVYCSQNSSTPSPSTTVTQTVTTTAATQTVTTTQAVHSTATCPTPTPGAVQRDCQEFHSNGSNQSGVYTIQPDSLPPFDVYCDMDTDGGGWTVWQRRQDGSVDFYRNWDNYVAGFGDLSGEFWLGLDKINRLTNASSSELRVDLGDFDNQTRYAKFSSFKVGDASTKYVLTISGSSGTAGNSFGPSGSPFSTYDQDNDDSLDFSCAYARQGAWWNTYCAYSNLNGRYMKRPDSTFTGVFWNGFRVYYSLKFSEIKVRRSN